MQAYDATLTSIAALGTGSGKMLYSTGVDTWAEANITLAGRQLIDDASASAQRTTLGLGGLATLDILDEDDMATNSATRPPSQQSTKAYVDGQIASSGFPTPDFSGSEKNLSLGGSVTWAHGLGATPTFFTVHAVCKVANSGYAVGDEIPLNNGMSISSRSFGCFCNSTQIEFAAQSSIRICAADLSEIIPSSPNFKLVARAWA